VVTSFDGAGFSATGNTLIGHVRATAAFHDVRERIVVNVIAKLRRWLAPLRVGIDPKSRRFDSMKEEGLQKK
jgi:hypothetical protein